MCGRFGFIYPSTEDWAEAIAELGYSTKLQEAFEKELSEYAGRTNIAPTQTIATIAYSEKEKSPVLVPMRWGWEPLWRPYGQIHNANLETILNPHKNTWKKDFTERRCLIPATFFYDWQRRDDGTKLPWKIQKANGKLMLFAGVYQYEPIRSNREEKVLTVAMITQHGNRLMQKLNNDEPPGTQPVILDHDQLSKWLNPEIKDPQEIAGCIRTYAEAEIKVQPLSKVGNDKTGEPPVAGTPADPYEVKTEYYPEPTETRYQQPKKPSKTKRTK